jgi:phosphoribosylaminoimidazole carboxylase/phosphoribosylaminoimidazole-succinocarboxamide synthase
MYCFILFKDDENHDPQWSYEQCVAAHMTVGGVLIGPDELDIMSRTTVTVFEILEKSWASLDCSLIDMKIEFGVKPSTGFLLIFKLPLI